MTPQSGNPLEQLRPIHLPPEISWWPPAPGWWLLLLTLLLLLWMVVRRYRLRRPQRLALKALRALKRQNHPPQQLAAQLNLLLKQYILSSQSTPTPTTLSGEAWLQFLESRSRKGGFTAGIGALLLTLPYCTEAQSDAGDTEKMAQLTRLVRHWIKHNPPERSAHVPL